MALVATLIANPSNPVLEPKLGEAAADAVKSRSLYWLADGVACDIPLPETMSAEEYTALLREVVAGRPVDVAVQDVDTRRKKLLIADMDSTMIGQECIDELAAEVGLKDMVAAITARAMNGEIAFEPALRERVALLKGLDVSVIDKVIADRITLTPGGIALVRTMKARGGYTALVSGGFTSFTGKVAAMIGFDENRANILEVEDGRLAGTVTEPILGKEAKLTALMDLSRRFALSRHETLAIGDGANDLAMIRAAGLGVAYHAKPKVAAEAAARIDHNDLTALLFAQGFRREEFVT